MSFRVAATFNSPRYAKDATRLYGSLRSIRTMATDGISSISSVVQDRRSIEVESSAGDVHIAETGGELTVYVPRNKRKQAFCFASPLSIELADWLMREPSTLIREEVDGAMVTALSTLLAVAPSAMSLVLDHQGIVQVPIANEDTVSSDDDSLTPDTDSEDGDDTAGHLGSRTDQRALESWSEHASASQGRYRSYRSPSTVSSINRVASEDLRYRELLNSVVRAARHARFPSQGSFDMVALSGALPGDAGTSYNGFESVSRDHSDSTLERNFKIGAAGELYVSRFATRNAGFDADKRLDRSSKYSASSARRSATGVGRTGRAISATVSLSTKTTPVCEVGAAGPRPQISSTVTTSMI